MTWEIRRGDALTLLRQMPESSVQVCVTSPPYWGLRDYGTASWAGGTDDCAHVEMAAGMSDRNTLGRSGYLPPSNAANVGRVRGYRHVCESCGAVRKDSQLGLEDTPGLYVTGMVEVFREVRRVLRPDGTLWLNLGDSYASSPAGNTDATWTTKQASNAGSQARRERSTLTTGLKPKDLVGVPWRVAFALQADGWWLRSDIVWSKPNPMPESVTDRPTKAHEYLFLLAKSEKYFYDAEAIAEAISQATIARFGSADVPREGPNGQDTIARSLPTGRTRTLGAASSGRNKRTVWTITSEPFPEAHFAVMPQALVEPCVLAGSSARACEDCGAPWARVIERIGGPPPGDHRLRVGGLKDYKTAHPVGTVAGSALSEVYRKYGHAERRTAGWEPTCGHDNAGTGRSLVLDPFAGSGTVGVVALRHGRRFLGLELSPAYCAMARRRIAGPLFAAAENA